MGWRGTAGADGSERRKSRLLRSFQRLSTVARSKRRPIDNGRAHLQVWSTFRAAERASVQTRDDWVLVGNIGHSLRGLRNQVDYLDKVPSSTAASPAPCATPERILALLPRLEFAS